MNSEKLELSEKVITEILFDFIKQHYNDFGHHHKKREKSKWWHNHNYGKQIGKRGDSWAPFVEACFINEGEKRGYGNNDGKIGHSFTHPNITKVFSEILKRSLPYNKRHKYDDYLSIDVSWRNKENKLIFALEHSEDAKKTGTVADAQLIEIFDEIDKLKNIYSVFKVIVSRPHIRRKDHGDYNLVVNDFKKQIENKLLNLKPCSEENWIIILVAPETDLKRADERTKIKIHSYKWEIEKLTEVEGDYSFEVKMDNGGNIIKV